MRRVRELILLLMTIVFLTGCVQKKENTDTTVGKSVIKALETNEHVEKMQSNTKKYILKTDRKELIPQIIINESDKTFSFSYDVMSSYLATGTYKENDEQLESHAENTIISTDEGVIDSRMDCQAQMRFLENYTGSAIEQKEAVSADIEKCIREKFATFEEECELLDLWYDKEKSDRIIDMKYGKGLAGGVKRENIIVIMSDLKTGENTWSFESHTIYTDWGWILIRDNQDSEWVVDDYGNV